MYIHRAHLGGPEGCPYTTLRVHVPNYWVLRVLAIVIVVQVLGKYMIIGYLDPEGYRLHNFAACLRDTPSRSFRPTKPLGAMSGP